MAQSLILKVKGLQTNSNQLSEVSQGSLSVANNIVIDKDSVGESRRGLGYYAAQAANSRVDRLTSYQSGIVARRSNDNKLSYYSSGVWTDYSGTYSNPDDDYARMRFLQASGNLYFTTSLGVYVLDQLAGPVYSTGMPKGLDGTASLSGASGFLADQNQIAYRIVWGSKDVNNNLYLGAPSQRIIIANNSGGTRDVSVVFTIPSGITTDDFYQIYRSKESGGVSIEPNDELQLVYEANPTSGEITAKSVTVLDQTPFSLMGAYLYTNSSQEGIAESNDQPPAAKDIAQFEGYTFYINTRTKHQLNVSLLSVGGTNGLALNDTITIDGMVFTAKGAENIANREFLLSTGGSAAQNIEDTAKSLIKVINQYSSNSSVYAYYLSGYQELPGQLLIEARTLTTSSFNVSVSRSTAWDIDDGVSDNQEFINGIMWSKNQQPEHVPGSHLEFVGSKNFEARRLIALRDSLFILKDDGIFRLTGSGGSWNISPLDTSTKIIAPDSAVVLNNQIYCLTDQGIVAISDVGVEVKSRDIENLINEITSEDYDKLKKLSFGVAYETDRKYMLWTISSTSDTAPTKALVYNTFTNAWVNWQKSVTCGFVNVVDDKLYFGDQNSVNLFQERKNFDFTDYTDEALTGYNVVSVTGTTVVLDSVSNIDVGDIVYQSANIYAFVTAVSPSTTSVTVASDPGLSVAACSILKAIECEIEFTNEDMDNPGVMKHFQEVAWLFREKLFKNGLSSFYTDLSGGYENTTINGVYGGDQWGNFTWGNVPWGGILRPSPIRVFVPREKSRGSLLSIRLKITNAYAKWSLNGVSIQWDYVSERMTRS